MPDLPPEVQIADCGPDWFQIWVGGQVAACGSVVHEGRVRIDKHPNRIGRRSVFVRDRGAAMDYLSRWAWTWRAELVKEYGVDLVRHKTKAP
jgi:hypothetical protein